MDFREQPAHGPAFVEELVVGKFHGVGPVTAAQMNALGIHTGSDLRQWSREDLAMQFGKMADYLDGIARGIDHRPVEADRVRKSVGAENTFGNDLLAWEDARTALAPVLSKVWATAFRGGHAGKTVTVKVKYSNFHQITRSRSFGMPIESATKLEGVNLE